MTSPRPLVSSVSRHVLIAGAGVAVATGLAIWADRRREPDADGTSTGRIDRKEALDMTTGITSGFGVGAAIIAAISLSQLYGGGRPHLNPLELNVLKATYALAGGAVVGATLNGFIVNGSGEYDTRHIPKNPAAQLPAAAAPYPTAIPRTRPDVMPMPQVRVAPPAWTIPQYAHPPGR